MTRAESAIPTLAGQMTWNGRTRRSEWLDSWGAVVDTGRAQELAQDPHVILLAWEWTQRPAAEREGGSH